MLLVIVVNYFLCLYGMRAAKSLTCPPTPLPRTLGCAARSFINVTTNFETQPEHRLRPSTSTSTSTSPSPSLTTESLALCSIVVFRGIVFVDW